MTTLTAKQKKYVLILADQTWVAPQSCYYMRATYAGGTGGGGGGGGGGDSGHSGIAGSNGTNGGDTTIASVGMATLTAPGGTAGSGGGGGSSSNTSFGGGGADATSDSFSPFLLSTDLMAALPLGRERGGVGSNSPSQAGAGAAGGGGNGGRGGAFSPLRTEIAVVGGQTFTIAIGNGGNGGAGGGVTSNVYGAPATSGGNQGTLPSIPRNGGVAGNVSTLNGGGGGAGGAGYSGFVLIEYLD